MSLGYADRLKQKRNLGGQLGAKEYHQSFDEIREGVRSLARWVSEAQRVFVFTGAGISTSSGIPDFRGPNGIWTLRKKKAPLPTDFTPFEFAKPSFTHMAIAGLVAAGKVPYVCSQNVDSLHLWSGVPRDKLAELHGNCFAERCTTCRTEYARDFQMETVDFKPSGRRCTRPGCGGPLVDNILDWDTPLPEDELNQAVQQAEEADVALVLGTSLQIQPANEIPTLTRDEGGKMVIVNLQKTPKDRKASLIIRGRVDVVMALMMQELGLQVPPYIRTESLVVEHRLKPAANGSGRALTVSVHSRHGHGCPLPMVESLRIAAVAVDTAIGEQQSSSASSSSWGPFSSDALGVSTSGGGGSACYSHTFGGFPDGVRRVRCTLQVRLVKWADADKRKVTLQHEVDLAALTGPTPGLESVHAASATTTQHSNGASSCAPSAAGSHAACNKTREDARGIGGGDGRVPAVLPQPTTALQGSSVDSSTAAGSGSEPPASTTCVEVMHSFVSQKVDYVPAEVISAFLENPPPVVVPEPRKKRQKTPSEAAPAAPPTRTSLRRTRTSVKAQEATQAVQGLSPDLSSLSAGDTASNDSE